MSFRPVPRRHHLLSSILVSVVLGVTAMFLTGPSASAATQCSGSKVDSGLTDDSVAQWVLYYNSSTGKNCAVLNSYGSHKGHLYSMSISIAACRTKSSSSCGDYVTDEGNYHTYAGPVSVSARGKCVELYYQANLSYNSWVEGPVGPFHCG